MLTNTKENNATPIILMYDSILPIVPILLMITTTHFSLFNMWRFLSDYIPSYLVHWYYVV